MPSLHLSVQCFRLASTKVRLRLMLFSIPSRLLPVVGSGLLAGVLGASPATQVAGAPVPCADPMFAVDASDPDLTVRICRIAAEIRNTLNRCSLRQNRFLRIEVVAELDHPMGTCLAYFDCDFDLVRITDPQSYESLLEEDSPYARLPPMVMMQALLTHELTHALTVQSAGQRQIDIVDQEYIAAAMELEYMAQKWRDAILLEVAADRPPSVGLIDLSIYGFAPRKFAVNVWRHFRQPENGCDLIKRIIAGEVSFSKPVRPDLQ